MSSVAKGNEFEDRVFAAVKEQLRQGGLGFEPKACKAFKKKGYYSRDREADIIVDVSIEIWQPGATNWSILWACECKDYSGRVPVDDLEEFKSKIDQVAGANKKGVFATSGALQKSALTYAKNNGIGVFRLMPDDQVSIIMYMATGGRDPYRLTANALDRALGEPHYESKNRDFYGLADTRGYGDMGEFLRATLSA